MRDIQDRLLAEVPRSVVVRRYSNLPAMAVDLDAESFDRLLGLTYVRSIEENLVLEPHLDASGPLVHSSEVQGWGFDGTGWAVAVLDTGVGTSPGASDIVAPQASAAGVRRVASKGNLGASASWTLYGLTLGTTYYWSVQTIDSGFLGSAFAGEQNFVDLSIFSNGFESGTTAAWSAVQ